MNKNERFNPLSVSQNSTLSAYSRILVPSHKPNIPQRNQPFVPAQGILEIFKVLTNMGRSVMTSGDRELQDKVKSIAKDVLQEALGNQGGRKVTFEVTIQVTGFGEYEVVSIDIARPENSISFANPNPDFVFTDRTYKLLVDVNTDHPEDITDTEVLEKLKQKINGQTNVDPRAAVEKAHREHEFKEMNERMRGDARGDRGYREQIDRAEGRGERMWA